jgi:hypothetical protein
MLNDSHEAETLLSNVKIQLKELFHSKIPIYEKYLEMFKEEPTKKVKEYFEEI